MNTKNHFSRIKTNLEILRRIGVKVPDGDFLCPECFSPFNEYEIKSLILHRHLRSTGLSEPVGGINLS